jgi:hypothetical protein
MDVELVLKSLNSAKDLVRTVIEELRKERDGKTTA